MTQANSRGTGMKYMLAGGSVVAAIGLLIDPSTLLPNAQLTKDSCQEIIQQQATLSRDELSRLLTIPERSNRSQVRQVISQPFCKLQKVQIRVGATSQREAYPLEFDPSTWLVVLYEGDEYAGYSFSFRHEK
jgi:hypothetical protein